MIEDLGGNDRRFGGGEEKRWKEAKMNEHIFHEDKCNSRGSMWYKCEERKLKFDMLLLFRTNLPKKGDKLKNPELVLTEDKNKIALASKICLNLILDIS